MVTRVAPISRAGRDHGKSTLADRLLELTGTISTDAGNKQVLDKLEVERERGITVKAQTVSLIYPPPGSGGCSYLLNLIDTPGHVDFHYEVSRSMAACQGALLVVDATQGIQAQTLANYNLAIEQGLQIIPVINKIDLDSADVEKVKRELEDTLFLDCSNCILISAKSGLNVASILPAIVEQIRPPPAPLSDKPKILLFDSWYDNYKGVISLVAVKEGRLRRGDEIFSMHSGKLHQIAQVGMPHPQRLIPTETLEPGQVGYMITSTMKNPNDAFIGDTFHLKDEPVEELPGFMKPQPMVFAGIFPLASSEFNHLQDALDKLTINDSSVHLSRTSSTSLGMGFRCGFLGMLHMDVFRQRLEQEFEMNVIITNPSVFYKIFLKDGTEKVIENPSEFPEDVFQLKRIEEPYIKTSIISPEPYLGSIMQLCDKRRGKQSNMEFIGNRVLMEYDMPLAEVVENHFFNELKQISSGFASLSMKVDSLEFKQSDVVRMDVTINGVPVDALSTLAHRDSALESGRELAEKLSKLIDRQMFEIVIQVMLNGRPASRSVIKPMRKNVTAKCYGGDVTRKMKLLEKQKEGKKRMKMIGRVEVSPDVFLALVQRK